jgi:chemotaxis protein MotB
MDRLSGVGIAAFANSLETEGDRLAELLEIRTAALEAANGEIATLVAETHRLSGEVDRLTAALASARAAHKEAKARIAALGNEIGTIAGERNRLADELAAKTAELEAAETRITDLEAALVAANERIAGLEDERDRLIVEIGRLQAEVDEATSEIAKLKDVVARQAGALDTANAKSKLADEKIAALEAERDRLNGELAAKTDELANANEEIARLNDEVAKLTGTVATLTDALDAAIARIMEFEAELADCNTRIAELEAEREKLVIALDDANAANAKLQAAVEECTQQLAERTADRDRLALALTDANARIGVLEGEVAELTKKIDRFRGLFFARLKGILGDNPDITIVGDRFIIQSEVLFAVGSAALNADGTEEIEKVARVVRDFQRLIPDSIRWVLQVNGHADKQPIIGNRKFASNWELSVARALTVVQLLQKEGVEPERLAAAGFGEYQPMVPGDTQAAYARNRRIEFKLTDDGPYDAGS